MELITDSSGHSAQRLSEVELTAEEARSHHAALMRDVVRMLCLGMIHGDLSEYNVLLAADGPVIIDLPQVVSAAGNNAARDLLLRDVHNIRNSLARFAPELQVTHFGEEMWALYQQGKLKPDSVLTGQFVFDETAADVDDVLLTIEDARQEAIIRQQRREEFADPKP
jgi:RIO kinase 1